MSIKAGAASIITTPPVGVEIAGYGFGPSVGILENLEAQALYLAQDDTQVVIISVDLLTIGAESVSRIRQQVTKTLGIPGAHQLFAASHSHSSPTTSSLRQWGVVNEGYQSSLEAALIGLISMAYQNSQSARLGFALGVADNLSENRRGITDLRDTRVPVLCVQNQEGQTMAILFNFACHPVSLHSYRNLLSPDYPGYTRATIRRVLETPVISLFTLGTAGDINPAGYRPNQTTPQRSRQIGTILGCEVARLTLDPQIMDNPVMRITQKVIELPVVHLPDPAELRRTFQHFSSETEKLQAEGRPWTEVSVSLIQRDWAADALQEWEKGQVRDSLACEVSVLRIGDVVLLAAPLEIFTATGLAIKQYSPAAMTIICSNANGGIGYLPTQDAYEQGDYTNPDGLAPKVYGIYALAENAELIFREQAISLINELS